MGHRQDPVLARTLNRHSRLLFHVLPLEDCTQQVYRVLWVRTGDCSFTTYPWYTNCRPRIHGRKCRLLFHHVPRVRTYKLPFYHTTIVRTADYCCLFFFSTCLQYELQSTVLPHTHGTNCRLLFYNVAVVGNADCCLTTDHGYELQTTVFTTYP